MNPKPYKCKNCGSLITPPVFDERFVIGGAVGDFTVKIRFECKTCAKKQTSEFFGKIKENGEIRLNV